jgi:DNA gyrase subunit A
LKEKFKLTREQANAILDMPLRRLTGLEIEKLVQERKELVATIEELVAILGDPAKVTALIKKELAEVRAKYGDERLTEIVDAEGELTIEDLIAEERMVITVTHQGYIKRTRPAFTGVSGAAARERPAPTEGRRLDSGSVHRTTHNYMMFFTNKGKAYWLKFTSCRRAAGPRAAGRSSTCCSWNRAKISSR